MKGVIAAKELCDLFVQILFSFFFFFQEKLTDGNYMYHGGHFVLYIIVKTLCCIPETNTIQHINYTAIKKKTKEKREKKWYIHSNSP